MYKYLGLIMILLSWVSGAFLLLRWKGERTMSISQHAASSPSANKFFSAVLIVGGFIFYLWLISWFAVALQLSNIFIIIISLCFGAQVIAAVIPDTVGWRSKVHKIAAYFMAMLYIPMTYLIITSGNVSEVTQIVGFITVAYMIVAFWSFFFVPKANKHYLILQSVYVVLSHVTILSAAYIT